MLTRDELEKKRRYPEGDDDALIDTAIALYDMVEAKDKQIEDMKNCWNCGHNDIDHCTDTSGDMCAVGGGKGGWKPKERTV